VYGEIEQQRGRSLLRVLSEVWLPRLLFWLACAASAGLLGLVLLAPLLRSAAAEAAPDGGALWLELFAHDATVRRTAVASGVGLLATACVFFRPPTGTAPRKPARKPRPPSRGVGA
jgi:hypothetical protein